MSRCVSCGRENRNGCDVCDACRERYEEYERREQEAQEDALAEAIALQEAEAETRALQEAADAEGEGAMTTGQARKGKPQDYKDGARAKKRFKELLSKGDYLLTMDEGCVKTGNLYIELKCRGVPSRFTVLRPRYWVFEFKPQHWLTVPDDVLRDHVERAKRCKLVTNGGDNDETYGVLVPIRWLLRDEPLPPAEQIHLLPLDAAVAL